MIAMRMNQADQERSGNHERKSCVSTGAGKGNYRRESCNDGVAFAETHFYFGKYLSDFWRLSSWQAMPDGAALFLDEGEEYKPDMMVVCDPNKLQKKGVYGAPDLVVEVLSPGTARNDRGHKKNVYERCGVREYWIVNPADMSVEQYVLENDKFVLRDVYTHYLPADLEDMTVEEKAEVVTEFKCTLFDDLTIRLEDIFYRVTSGV